MPTPVSVPQINKLLELLGNPSGEKFQYYLANGDLLKLMVDADLARVDRSAFGAVVSPMPESIAWRPVSEYAEKIIRWSKLRGWGLTKTQIDVFAANLVDHPDSLHPTGISLWLDRDLLYNWEEVIACLKYEVEALGEEFTQDFTEQVSFFPGSERGGKCKLTVALLDIETYWDPINCVVPNEVRGKEAKLPGLEVAWLLALNPEVYLAIDDETIPGFFAAGLDIDSGPDRVPFFGHDSTGAFVNDRWGGHGWVDSVVRFGE